MNRTLLAAAAALAVATPLAVAHAQDTVVTTDAHGNVYVMTEQQQMDYDSWPPERQTVYTAWPVTYQGYYWTLSPERQTGWWVLDDSQRASVYAMTPEQRETTWASIIGQMNKMQAKSSVAASSSGNLQFASKGMVQPVPQAATSGDYPICGGKVQDHCIQPRAAGKNYGNRPLDYWPGKPASEG
ncbi:MAG: hypothetical protein IE933_13705 [Sphingomonadales bacterium]|nr:hypothetical protein [Sphingomonadales bacterium]MBD3775121.1 hypothetical protein [Paracoccaceae bacterium]